jgi:hypothetical protein
MAVLLHRRQGLPLPWFEDDLTGHLGRGTARHGDMVDTPGHDHVYGQGMQSPLLRLHTPLFNLTPLLEHPEKEFYFPPTAIPLHYQACP